MKIAAKCKICSIINGEHIFYKRGDSFDVDEEEGTRLISKGAAEECITSSSFPGNENSGSDNSLGNSSEDNSSDENNLTAEQLDRMTKDEIVKYAEYIQVEISKDMKKSDMINKVVDAIAEKEEFGGDDE